MIERIKNIPVYEWERARKRHIKKAMEESDVDDIFKFSVNDKDSLEVREKKQLAFKFELSCPGMKKVSKSPKKYTCKENNLHFFESSHHGRPSSVQCKSIIWIINHLFALLIPNAEISDYFPQIIHPEQCLKSGVSKVFKYFCSICAPYLVKYLLYFNIIRSINCVLNNIQFKV